MAGPFRGAAPCTSSLPRRKNCHQTKNPADATKQMIEIHAFSRSPAM